MTEEFKWRTEYCCNKCRNKVINDIEQSGYWDCYHQSNIFYYQQCYNCNNIATNKLNFIHHNR
jgi:hypothetical protein